MPNDECVDCYDINSKTAFLVWYLSKLSAFATPGGGELELKPQSLSSIQAISLTRQKALWQKNLVTFLAT